MILGIEVLCEACGTELEITDVNTDHLLKVALKARPCPKCNRPPDCHLSCEDVLELRRKLKTATDKVKTLSSLMPIEDNLGDIFDDDEDTDYPSCFGKYSENASRCSDSCDWITPCMNKK